jgi:eukaryotic-like serine/threonine-protein kinase
MGFATVNSIASFDASQLIGMSVGGATLLHELGRGNMGLIFTAYQQSLKRQIAVKVLPKCMYTEESVCLFTQEAEAAAGLSHPNIMPIYEVGETEGFRYFTMQLIDGLSLAALLRKLAKNVVPSRRILPIRTSLSIIKQVLEALSYAHKHGVIHRDIKPENILILAESHIPVIADFGISRIISSQADALQIPRGSPLYMAPEQILSNDADARADIYAVGVLLFRLLVKELPIKSYSSPEDLLKAKLTREGIFVNAPSQADPRLNPEMDVIIDAATAHDPMKRYSSCKDFLTALTGFERKFLRSH